MRLCAKQALSRLGNATIAPLIEALRYKNRFVQENAEELLFWLDSLSRESLMSKLKSETDPTVRLSIGKLLNLIERKQELVSEIKEDFGIEISEKPGTTSFTLRDLEKIQIVLKGFPLELIDMLERIEVRADGWAENKFGGRHIDLPRDFSMDTLAHEIAHSIDDCFYNDWAFAKLHKKSKFPEDSNFKNYPYPENALEDFATTVQYYVVDSQKEFLRAIKQAKEGKAVYLEKVLFVLDIFTGNFRKGGPTGLTTRIFRLTDEKILAKDITITRNDKGEIVNIDNVNIYNPDGAYNFADLEKLFKDLLPAVEGINEDKREKPSEIEKGKEEGRLPERLRENDTDIVGELYNKLEVDLMSTQQSI